MPCCTVVLEFQILKQCPVVDKWAQDCVFRYRIRLKYIWIHYMYLASMLKEEKIQILLVYYIIL